MSLSRLQHPLVLNTLQGQLCVPFIDKISIHSELYLHQSRVNILRFLSVILFIIIKFSTQAQEQ